MVSFEELGIETSIVKALKETGIEQPFPIQESIIPLILKGEDVIGRSNTGTGKTAAFVLPMLSKLNPKNFLQALILVPTRELAVQITNTINQLVKYSSLKSVAIYGGQNIQMQKKILNRGVNIVVATPGRLLDHMNQRTINLSKINFLVLDEADRMLDMGFIDDIKEILSYMDNKKQICLFSATMPDSIVQLAKEQMTHPKQISIEKTISQENINQSYLLLNEKDKFKQLVNTLKPISSEKDSHIIVFTATKQRARDLTYKLRDDDFFVESIHGDLNQRQRESTLSRFRSKRFNILIATDVASRGLDIASVSHIINYDIPDDVETYFHRIGRTARAGANGTALSFVSQHDMFTLRKIQNIAKNSLKNLNTEYGIEVDFNLNSPPRPNRFRSNYSRGRSNYGGGGYGGGGYGGGGYGRGDGDGSRRRSYGRSKIPAEQTARNNFDSNKYQSRRLSGITRPLGRRNNYSRRDSSD
ncbi:DEAD/DEAH box helicase [Candidatus Nitrosocosmicus agrestis]|uniref:DEAD/DEAH box helicase n=1 Tax=Candidatus Nitrosocosmicus agrestis TaxID=2563600 RepID=UPI00122DDD24|nr:DEAD/DEAH box helicase [Candidatus Nitrosocosmicus sp. SS]KAA2283755.1 DEAD/DEAH box helicase [Candidatus Nitrosocosmicus sp. SS]KAF0870131.1 DEAD/DEAH box helicase [Candidatus Nitrosocosmicus sp. SS]